jgi:hypothetical protein
VKACSWYRSESWIKAFDRVSSYHRKSFPGQWKRRARLQVPLLPGARLRKKKEIETRIKINAWKSKGFYITGSGPRRWYSPFFNQIRMLSMNCSSSGAHLFSLERECSLESTDQLKKEWANQGRGGNTNQFENKDRSITLARRVSEQVCFLLHWCRIQVYWPLTKRRQLRARGGESLFRERYFPAWDSWLIG